jgi:hypothetical protein
MQAKASLTEGERRIFEGIACTTNESWSIEDLAFHWLGPGSVLARLVIAQIRELVVSVFFLGWIFGSMSPKRWQITVILGLIFAVGWVLSPTIPLYP